MELKTYFALDGNARVIPNVRFYVYLAGTNTLAPYLEDENGIELPNPFSSGTTGKVFFAAPNGDYDIRSVKNGVESVERVQFNDVSDSVDAAVAAAAAAEGSAIAAEAARDQTIELIESRGYRFAGDYAAGIELTEYNQLVRDENGEFWSVSRQVDLPYVTTGTGVPEDDALVPAGDAVLRQDLANPDKGAAMVALGIDPDTFKFDNVGSALSVLNRSGKVGVFSTKGYLPDDFRGGVLAYSKDLSGRARLVTDLSRFFPVGAFALPTPMESRSIQIEVAASSFTATGATSVYRAVVPGFMEDRPDGYRPRAGVMSKSGSRIYLDERSFPSADFSSAVRVSHALGGTVVEVRVPSEDDLTDIIVDVRFSVISTVNKVFIDPANGRDRYDGSSPDWALQTFGAALALEPDVIFIVPGIYESLNYLGTYTADKDISVQCVGGVATFISMATNFSAWVLDQGSTYVTTVSGSPTVVGAVDLAYLDETGLPSFLHTVSTLEECRSTPGSSYWDAENGRKLYVHLHDGRVPVSSEVKPVNSHSLIRHSAPGRKVHIKNIICVGGSGGVIAARDAGADSVLISENCAAVGMYTSNGFDIKDVGLFIGINSRAADNMNDGFNYSVLNGVSPHFIEIDCTGYRNRASGTGNGSTSHNDCRGFRINTNCFENEGPGIADVGNAITYVVSASSNNNGPSLNAGGIRADGNAVIYVDGAGCAGNSGAGIEGTNGGRVVVRDVFCERFGEGVESFGASE